MGAIPFHGVDITLKLLEAAKGDAKKEIELANDLINQYEEMKEKSPGLITMINSVINEIESFKATVLLKSLKIL